MAEQSEIRVGGRTLLLLIEKRRRRSIELRIMDAGQLRVAAPAAMTKKSIVAFIEKKAGWIEKKLSLLEREAALPPLTQAQLSRLMKSAREVLSRRTEELALSMGAAPAYCKVKDQRSVWGTCTGKNGINLNWRLILCPPQVMDYVIFHELAHLSQRNHSAAFWALVQKYDPDYKNHRKWLKEEGRRIFALR